MNQMSILFLIESFSFGILSFILLYSILRFVEIDIRISNLFVKYYSFILSIYVFFYLLFFYFDYSSLTSKIYQFENFGFSNFDSLSVYNFGSFISDYVIAVDSFSIFFLLLTGFIMPICFLISFNYIGKYVFSYYFSLLILELVLILTFSVIDIFLFYIFFESILIPMFFIIGIWGSRTRKIKASYYFFLFTFFGSIFILFSIIVIYLITGTTYIIELKLIGNYHFFIEKLLWLCMFFGLAVKIPMFPVHIWLPEAHVEAPTAGSVILASLLLKLGGYGFLRIVLPLFSKASLYFSPLVYIISVIGIIYASLTTIRQIDLKKIIAYSSVAHMNFVMLGIFSFNLEGIVGSIVLMIGHGFVSGALFIIVGLLYERYQTRLIYYYGGLTRMMPLFSFFFCFFSLANMGLPGTSNFVGEFLILIGIFQINTSVAFFGFTGTVLSAVYSLWLYNRVSFGSLNTFYIKNYYQINNIEFFVLVLLFLGTLVLGVYPKLLIEPLIMKVNFFLYNITNFI